jgi:hypothetical protein
MPARKRDADEILMRGAERVARMSGAQRRDIRDRRSRMSLPHAAYENDRRLRPLMPGVVAVGLLAVEAKCFHHGKVVEREQAGVLARRCIAVLVPDP